MTLLNSHSATLIKNPGTDKETRQAVTGSLQGRKAYFRAEVPVEVGDQIELIDGSVTQKWIVAECVFQPGMGGIPSVKIVRWR